MEQQQLAALAEIAAIIGQDLVPERVLERILEQSCDLLEVPVGLFTLDDGDPDELAVVAARGVPAELIGRFPKGYGITSQILGHGQTVSVPDYQAYERAVPAFATQGYRALIGTPVRGAEQVLGCLILTTTDPFRQFTAEEQRFLELLSRHAGIALDHARLSAQARQREQEQTLLAEVSQRLSASLNLDGVLPEVARRVAVALGAGGVALALPTPTHDELTIGAYYAADRFSEPAPAPLLRALRIRPGVGIVGQAFATGDVQIVADYQVDVRAVPELAQHLATLHAVLAVPLRVREQTLGVLICGRLGRRDPFGPREIRLASALAERIAGAVANAQLHQAVARAAEELRQSEVRHRAVVERAYDAIVTTSPDGLIQAFNQAAERLFGYAATDVIGQPISLLLPDRFLEEQRIGGRPESLPARPLETAGRRRSGVVFPLELTISEVRTDREWFYTWIMRSISERRALAEQLERARQTEIEERALRQSEERFRLLVQHATDLILLLDAEQLICYQSPSSRALLGYAPEALLGQPLTRYAHPDEVAAIERLLAQALAAPGQPLALELRLRHADGAWRQCEAVCQNLLDQPGIASLVLNVRDISERKRLEGQLVHQAFHDGLTHLPNRALFVDRLAHALVRATRRSQGIGLLALDLDQFKVINESLGHQAGDQVLVAMGQILQACVSPEDTVARLSGDQFVVLREEDGDIRALIALADTIAARLRAPLVVEGQEVVITASVGIVLHTTAEARAEDLLRDVELALYEAKRQGKARYAVFDPEMAARANARLRLETELRRALHHDELRVFYQPILELKSGRLSGLEALVRWQHPQRGLIPPGQFIPLAEETGLILPLGEWVLATACRQMVAWQRQAPDEPPLSLSVNCSARQFQQPNLVADLARTLRETGLLPTALTLEITESVAMDGAEATLTTLRALKQLGVRLAIDDFGTGYSALSYLKRFPVDVLKIDRSFVLGLGQQPHDLAIVRAVIAFAQTLQLRVTAEGVETADQLAALRQLGCDHGQGYYFARPLPSEAVPPFFHGLPPTSGHSYDQFAPGP